MNMSFYNSTLFNEYIIMVIIHKGEVYEYRLGCQAPATSCLWRRKSLLREEDGPFFDRGRTVSNSTVIMESGLTLTF